VTHAGPDKNKRPVYRRADIGARILNHLRPLCREEGKSAWVDLRLGKRPPQLTRSFGFRDPYVTARISSDPIRPESGKRCAVR
jgi:GNAT superfamily N-acetyltransferase